MTRGNESTDARRIACRKRSMIDSVEKNAVDDGMAECYRSIFYR
jgi:hypothetical protein